ncbi:LuxR C-terminal-related transcriptional regulator [Streptacidiphilus sp. N1-12]|uniref:LuxR C-terminal-related transcriptional regulator n=2 Tax=Streptacidiphilus alkalitolerans TaxID=3342712 RepID=A0ABV6VB27_9ACTN
MRTIHDGLLDGEDPPERDVRVLLADPDPIARHVLAHALRRAGGIELVAVSSDRTGMRDRPGGRLDAALLATDARESLVGLLDVWTAQRVPVLLIGTGWTPERLAAAMAAGSSGCLVKDIATDRLGAAVRAVASGHLVLSPELLNVYAAGAAGASAHRSRPGARAAGPGQAAARGQAADGSQEAGPRALLTHREREVLEILAEGLSTAEAARQLGVSPATVKSHVSHCLTKLGARNRLEAVMMVRPSAAGDDPHHCPAA